jgi:hypothetical protein
VSLAGSQDMTREDSKPYYNLLEKVREVTQLFDETQHIFNVVGIGLRLNNIRKHIGKKGGGKMSVF